MDTINSGQHDRIDLDSLSAALTASGWAVSHDLGFGGEPCIDAVIYSNKGVIGNHVVTLTIDASGSARCWGGIEFTAAVWDALDLIRAHTTPARSPDDARPTAGEES